MRHTKASLEANREAFYSDDNDGWDTQRIQLSKDEDDDLYMYPFVQFSCAYAAIKIHSTIQIPNLIKFVKKFRKPVLFTAGPELTEAINKAEHKEVKKLTVTDGWYDQCERGMPPKKITLFQVTL